ncbi:MAG: hypothetical protein ABMA13_23605 [Chthoniobacteraceae bacterium]
MKTNKLRRLPTRQTGSAILGALGMLALTAVVVGAALLESRSRYRTTHHSGRWTQAAHAAEAGAELALMSAQKDSWVADAWAGAPGAPGAAPITKTFTLSTGVPATGPIRANLSVDTISMDGGQWLRIRSTGEADVSGGALAGLDAQDVMLRKLSLRNDRTTGASVGATPMATRTVEILAEPTSKSPFKRALLLNKRFNMSGGTIDSFDSGDPTKSTGNLYDLAKRQTNGDVGINDTEGASSLGGAYVYGDLFYSGAAVTNTTNLQGTTTTPFSEPISPVAAPTWTTFNASPAVISSSMTLTGGTQAAPAKYKVSAVTVGGGKVLTMAPHAVGAESYIEVWVTGNFTTSGSGYILSEPGVHVTYHIAGDVTVSGSSFNNQSNIAANNIVNVISVGAASNQKVTVSGSGTFIGAINAPAAAFTNSGGSTFSGALIGKTMTITGGLTTIHYDEALGRIAGSGTGGGYRVKSWVEAVR